MNKKLNVLLVEDDHTISNFISTILTHNNYNVMKAERARVALQLIASQAPNLVLLDLGLPDMDGIEVIKKVREWSQVPIIVVSARGFEREKVQALDLGADDYITKPFGTSELLARIRTAVRHSNGNKETQAEVDQLTIGGLFIDFDKRIVKVDDKDVHLTPIEYKIIVLLSRNVGKVLTHDYIMREIWGPYLNENQTLRVNMANIRRKIEANPAEPRYIVTEVGVGYRMVDEV